MKASLKMDRKEENVFWQNFEKKCTSLADHI